MYEEKREPMSDPVLDNIRIRVINQEFPSCFEEGQCPEDPHKELLAREISEIKKRSIGAIATRPIEDVVVTEDVL